MRLGDTGYEVLLETKYNQLTDLAIEDFNSQQAYYDGINQSLLLQSKGVGENFKGQLTARAEYMKAIGSMAGNYNSSGSILSSVSPFLIFFLNSSVLFGNSESGRIFVISSKELIFLTIFSILSNSL